jgi:hypothetical protein
MGEEASKARLVTEHGAEPEMRQFNSFRVQKPRGVRFRAYRLPHLVLQIFGC